MIKGSSCKMFNFRCALCILFFVLSLDTVDLLENGMALTPPMGWMSWGYYMCSVTCEADNELCLNEALILSVADSFYTEGYQEAGYEYIIIDDCWSEKERDENGRLVADQIRFPRGMKFIADYIHARGLKFGMYTNIANVTCMHYPGSFSHMEIDAETFAEWGVDYLKVDGCFVSEQVLNVGYKRLGYYLNNTGRPMVFSCSWPYYIEFIHKKTPDYQHISKYCNLWRNYHDVQDSWDAVVAIFKYYEERYDELAPHHGPGHWNDPDMLIFGTDVLTRSQSRVQLAMMVMLSAPILLSCNMKKITPYEKELLQNLDLIAVAQDPLGIMAKPHRGTGATIWVKPHLPRKGDAYPSYTFAAVNMDFDDTKESIQLSSFQLNATDGYSVLEDAPIELYTDASSLGYGAVLVQVIDRRQHPIAYMSQRTTDAESRYHSYELETLAVVRAIKHFRQYLYGRKFKVITDCNALKASKHKKDLLPRVHRWWAFLQNYNFDVEYRKGERLQHADFFSRNPSGKFCTNILTSDMKWIQIEQRRDEKLRSLIENPTPGFEVEDNVLKKICTDTVLGTYKLTVVPKAFQWSLINSYHTSLHHPGWEKTLQKLKQSYWFDKMSTSVRNFVENCVICRTSKGPSGAIQVQLHPIQKPTAPFQVVHMDITGKLGTRDSHGRDEYVIVIIDAYTKYILLSYSNDKSQGSSLAALKRLIHLFATPIQIVVDGGREFLGEFKVYCDRVGIDIHSIAPGVSRANGQVERVMGTLKNSLIMIKNYNTEKWQVALEALQLAFNCTAHRVTGVAPLTLLTRRQHCVPPELLKLVNIDNGSMDFDLLEQHVNEKMTAAAKYEKQRFDKNKAKLKPFQRGDYVLIKNNPRNQTSLDLKYSEPFEIFRVLNNDRYMVKRVTGRGRPRKVAHDQLRRAPQPGDQATVSTESEEDNEQQPGTSQLITPTPERPSLQMPTSSPSLPSTTLGDCPVDA